MTYDRLVMLDDIGRVFTFKSGRVISGGFLVGFSSGTDIVSSGGNFGGYGFGDVLVDAGSCGSANYIGIALQTVGSEKPIAVAMDGIFVLPAGPRGINGGTLVGITSGTTYGSVTPVPVESTLTTEAGSIFGLVGRALSTATANTGFAIVKLW